MTDWTTRNHTKIHCAAKETYYTIPLETPETMAKRSELTRESPSRQAALVCGASNTISEYISVTHNYDVERITRFY